MNSLKSFLLECLAVGLLSGVLAGLGCDDRSSSGPHRVEEKSLAETKVIKGTKVKERWEAQFIQGAKVGYAHTRIEPLIVDGRQLRKTTNKTQLTIKRFGQELTQQVVFSDVETLAGELVQFECEMGSGEGKQVTVGRYEQGHLLLEMSSAGKSRVSQLPWEPAWGGFFAPEQSLLKRPMKPGESRLVRSLMPIFFQAVDTHLKAFDYEPTRLLSGNQQLLKIQSTVDLGKGQKFETTLWVDRVGEIHKTEVASLGQVSYLTTKEIALSQTESVEFDLGLHSTVLVNRPLENPHASRKIIYRAHLPQGDPSMVFATGASQSLKVLDSHRAEITVRAIGPEDPLKLQTQEDPPGKDDLAPNQLIQSDDLRIVEMAAEVTTDSKNLWKVATQLETLVHDKISRKDFSQAFASAAEVAQSLQGDCTEHAVLLTALCRVHKIPARVAIGLVYYPAVGGFAYHMWSEVWIVDRWVPLDATLARGGIGAAHLKITSTNLQGTGAYSAFFPVFQVLGQLELEIVEVQ